MANELEKLLRLNRTPAMPRGSNRLAGVVEPAMTAGSNILAEIPAYVAGMTELNQTGLPSEGVRRAEEVSESLTYNPRTMEGQAGLQSLTNGVMKVMDALGVDEAVNYLNNTVVPRIQETFGEDAAREIGSSVMMAIPFVRKVPGIKAFHGSPHDFDEFSMDAIGTGEGAQAYGHGLYVADSEDVAKAYRDDLTANRAEFVDPTLAKNYEIGKSAGDSKYYFYDRKSGYLDTELPAFRTEAEAEQFLQEGKLTGDMGFSRVRNNLQQQLQDSGYDFSVAEEAADRVALGILEGGDRKSYANFLRNNADVVDEEGNVISAEVRQATIDALDRAEEIEVIRPKGRMYEVEIDATPDELLDYDIALRDQPKAELAFKSIAFDEVQRLDDPLLNELLKRPEDMTYDNLGPLFETSKGGQAYKTFAETNAAKGRENLSKKLREKGIKGIRYKDGFSRNKDGGSYNYVIFDDRLISIAKKYGIAIPAAAALLSQETGLNPSSFYEEDNSV